MKTLIKLWLSLILIVCVVGGTALLLAADWAEEGIRELDDKGKQNHERST